ncbi:MAG: nucleoside deaminase [Clostridia bacterium]|nr:nucleoside deaminase [Clostridia bacterium]
MTREEKLAFMREALSEAKKCEKSGDVPVGCVIVYDGRIVGRGRNEREARALSTAHAEILAIEDACRTLGRRKLHGASLFVTLEPCPMCAGAVLLSRIGTVYIGALDFTTGACGSRFNLFDWDMAPAPKIEYGILKEECAEILSRFFENMRKKSHS